MKEVYVVKIDRPTGVSVTEMRGYIKDAVESWSGCYHPDHPLFGHFHENEVTVHRTLEPK